MLVCYALASRVQFEFAAHFAIPTQAIFVPAWLYPPAPTLPLAVCGGLLLGGLSEIVRRRSGTQLEPVVVGALLDVLGL